MNTQGGTVKITIICNVKTLQTSQILLASNFEKLVWLVQSARILTTLNFTHLLLHVSPNLMLPNKFKVARGYLLARRLHFINQIFGM